ncbi:MAG: hypothetical protein ACOYOM_15110, partial [Chloroflexota bacterium]
AGVPKTSSQAQLAETAGQPHPTENTVEETSSEPRTPGSAGALAGMILHASTDPPNNRWHAHHPPDHRVPFASGDETACLTGLNC